jgi:ADP-ribose pyrophosphatase YjhB (NUDIX family)
VKAAWRELNEEATLTQQNVALIRQGKPYSFSDQSVGRQWTIYPFAFLLRSVNDGGMGEKAIQTGWEYEEWGWYDPAEVKDAGHLRCPTTRREFATSLV